MGWVAVEIGSSRRTYEEFIDNVQEKYHRKTLSQKPIRRSKKNRNWRTLLLYIRFNQVETAHDVRK